ncbi:TPA: fimbrial protein [Serratia marcescens]
MRKTTIVLASLLAGLATMPVAANNMILHGALVAEPCTLAPGDESVKLEFGTVIDKYLYQNQRTLGKRFQLRLQDCDTSLGTSLQISFSGPISQALPGLLALEAGSQAQGVAIGFETPQGAPLVLNEWSPNYPLSKDNNVIALQAFIRAEPDAIANRKITLGEFTAAATFSLRYE